MHTVHIIKFHIIISEVKGEININMRAVDYVSTRGSQTLRFFYLFLVCQKYVLMRFPSLLWVGGIISLYTALMILPKHGMSELSII